MRCLHKQPAISRTDCDRRPQSCWSDVRTAHPAAGMPEGLAHLEWLCGWMEDDGDSPALFASSRRSTWAADRLVPDGAKLMISAQSRRRRWATPSRPSAIGAQPRRDVLSRVGEKTNRSFVWSTGAGVLWFETTVRPQSSLCGSLESRGSTRSVGRWPLNYPRMDRLDRRREQLV